MPIIPYYAQGIAKLGCCPDDKNLSEQLDELKRIVNKQTQQITELENALEGKIDKSALVTVYSLEDKPLFKAHPLVENN